ncbi:MAG: hypothetical protein QM754_18460 [Tepidisphaeraceae bacterium]
MSPQRIDKLVLSAARALGVAFALTVLCWGAVGYQIACTNVKGADTAKRSDYSNSVAVASTQASADHQAATHTSGGETRQAENAADITVTPAEVRVKVLDRADSTKQPTVINVERDRTAQTIKSDTRATTQTSEDTRRPDVFRAV